MNNSTAQAAVPGSKTYKLVAAALMCAVIAILSQIAIPMPSGVPVTLQTFAVALCGCVLEMRYSAAAAAVYILLGLVGVPVFSGFSAGPGRLFGPTGGFIWGFLLFAVLCSFSVKQKNRPVRIALCLCGLMVCHICGILQFAFVSGNGILPSFLLVSAPYLIKDAASVILAMIISRRIRKILPRINSL